MASTATESNGQAFANNINAWTNQDVNSPPPDGGIVFTGSSSIRRWEQLARDFAEYDIIQRGFGGSQFTDLTPVVDDIVLPYAPSAIVVWEGTNDISTGNKSPATVFNDYLTFVSTVRNGQSQGQADIPIFFLGITPAPSRAADWNDANNLNGQVQTHAAANAGLYYIDTATPFLNNNAPDPNSPFFVADRLHLNQDGYNIWTDVIKAAVAPVVAPKTFTPNAQAPAIGDRILFDFGASDGNNGNQTLGVDANGNRWNNWHDVGGGADILAGQRLNDLVDTHGDVTGVDLVITGGFRNNGRNHGGLLDADPALLGDFGIDTVTEDYFFGENLDRPAGFMLTGLDPDLEYEIEFFASRNTTQERITQYTVLGDASAATVLQTSGNNIGDGGVYDGNDSTLATLTGLRPDEFGQFFVDVERVGASFSYIGGLSITAIPEPVTAMVLVFTLAGITRQCRQHA